MTAAENKISDSVHQIELSVKGIETACGACSETVKRHDVILHGPAGNGKRPGLVTRVADITSSHNEMKGASQDQAKWFRRQLGAAIAALLAVLSAVVHHFMTSGVHN